MARGTPPQSTIAMAAIASLDHARPRVFQLDYFTRSFTGPKVLARRTDLDGGARATVSNVRSMGWVPEWRCEARRKGLYITPHLAECLKRQWRVPHYTWRPAPCPRSQAPTANLATCSRWGSHARFVRAQPA